MTGIRLLIAAALIAAASTSHTTWADCRESEPPSRSPQLAALPTFEEILRGKGAGDPDPATRASHAPYIRLDYLGGSTFAVSLGADGAPPAVAAVGSMFRMGHYGGRVRLGEVSIGGGELEIDPEGMSFAHFQDLNVYSHEIVPRLRVIAVARSQIRYSTRGENTDLTWEPASQGIAMELMMRDGTRIRYGTSAGPVVRVPGDHEAISGMSGSTFTEIDF